MSITLQQAATLNEINQEKLFCLSAGGYVKFPYFLIDNVDGFEG